MSTLLLPLLLVPWVVTASPPDRPLVRLEYTDTPAILDINGRWDPVEVVKGSRVTSAYHLRCTVSTPQPPSCSDSEAIYRVEPSGASQLYASVRAYDGPGDISVWSDTLIVLVSAATSCLSQQIVINRATKEVTKTMKWNKSTCPLDLSDRPASSKFALVGDTPKNARDRR
jgi:hypothetical protein